MGPYPWALPVIIRRFRRFLPWLLVGCSFGIVRWSKGAFFADTYAFLSRPFWPGTAQREWIQAGQRLENKSKISLLEKDNARLRGLLSLQKSFRNNETSAAVISRKTQGWSQQFELSKGSLQGIAKGDPVMGPGGLVGVIDSVTPLTSRVRLLTAPGSRIGVWVPRSSHHGLLLGRGTSRPQLIFLAKDPLVMPGDLVSTSPVSTLVPPNIPIGIIQSVDNLAIPAPIAVVQLIAAPEAIDWVQVKIR